MSSPEAFLIGLRYSHHAQRSGYESFHRNLDAPFLRAPLRFRYLNRAYKVDEWTQRVLDRPCYSLSLAAQEVTAGAHMLRHRDVPHHVIYADTDLRLLGAIADMGGDLPLIGTFHEPLWGLDYMRITERVTRGLAAVVLMSETQREWFAGLVDEEKLHVIPHGIDTEFFAPAGSPTREPIVIVVGSKYRDFSLLSKTIDVVIGEMPGVRFIAVGTHHNVKHPLDDERVEYLMPGNDEALRATYRSARVGVFPLMSATANNALLEAMACGLPCVSTDVGGIREYAGDAAALVPPDDPEALGAELIDLLSDDAAATELGRAARERVFAFDVSVAAAAHRELYASLRKG